MVNLNLSANCQTHPWISFDFLILIKYKGLPSKNQRTKIKVDLSLYYQYWLLNTAKSLNDAICLHMFSLKQINRHHLARASHGEVLGEGVFGVCTKKTYRGIMVAVKQFKENVHLSLVRREASVLAKMEHPGNLPYCNLN